MNQALIEATTYIFKLYANASGEDFTSCVALDKGHQGARIYIETWILPQLEKVSGMSYETWKAEEKTKREDEKRWRKVQSLESSVRNLLRIIETDLSSYAKDRHEVILQAAKESLQNK